MASKYPGVICSNLNWARARAKPEHRPSSYMVSINVGTVLK